MIVTWEEIRIQVSIVEQVNQQVGIYELSHTLNPTKTSGKKLHSKKAEARNDATILKNMIQEFAKPENQK